jgi:hypothetical protein
MVITPQHAYIYIYIYIAGAFIEGSSRVQTAPEIQENY